MPVNETVLIKNIKKSYDALQKNGEIGTDGFDYVKQLEFNIDIYEMLTNKSFDINLLKTL